MGFKPSLPVFRAVLFSSLGENPTSWVPISWQAVHALGHGETIQFSCVWWLGQSGPLCIDYHLTHFCLSLHTFRHLALKMALAVVFANRLFSSFHPTGCSFLISSLTVGAWLFESGKYVILQTAMFLHSL